MVANAQPSLLLEFIQLMVNVFQPLMSLLAVGTGGHEWTRNTGELRYREQGTGNREQRTRDK